MKKKALLIAIAIVVLLIGIGIMLYPLISNLYENAYHSEVIQSYQEDVNALNNEQLQEELKKARRYNDALHDLILKEDPFTTEFEIQNVDYENLLNINRDGVMSYVEIPEIDVYLPIYHGTTDDVLERGVGHIINTSLPIGGKSTHCVISAHSGSPSATLFTRLDELKEGDEFYLYTLSEKLSYEVDQIKTVLPHETDDFRIVEGQDYVTLVTCTPYGINTHRLLVRGHRIANSISEETIVNQEHTVAPFDFTAYIIALIILILTLIAFLVLRRIRKARKNQ